MLSMRRLSLTKPYFNYEIKVDQILDHHHPNFYVLKITYIIYKDILRCWGACVYVMPANYL